MQYARTHAHADTVFGVSGLRFRGPGLRAQGSGLRAQLGGLQGSPAGGYGVSPSG